MIAAAVLVIVSVLLDMNGIESGYAYWTVMVIMLPALLQVLEGVQLTPDGNPA